MVTVNPPEVNFNDMMTDDKKLLTLLRNLYHYGFCFIPVTPPTKQLMIGVSSRIWSNPLGITVLVVYGGWK